MKTPIACLVCTALFFAGTLGLRAEDWTTTTGVVYHNVTVLKVEPDAVTILYQDGGALVPLNRLPAGLQKRFNYDPAKAQAAAEARAAADAANQQALAKEKRESDAIAAKEAAESKAAVAAAKKRKAHHDGMPQEPAVLEVPKKIDNDALNPEK